MIELYCRGRHGAGPGLCGECRTLSRYAMRRIDRCPYGAGKPTCARCPIHCYAPGIRGQVRQVMRYAGPRMMLHHPMLTIMHYLDGLNKKVGRPR